MRLVTIFFLLKSILPFSFHFFSLQNLFNCCLRPFLFPLFPFFFLKRHVKKLFGIFSVSFKCHQH
ncbi:hypothetical protein ES319_D04G127500v1 [Gossypium barbadense]|uniref:Uncharacterized protein n=1 Tax=Gossypium barbadense TaxID=3634 RepID=A0A5J5RUR0_GOSBA|nr:hypothetical protein ES319_D04G127500v1 [Gossypium barbadense]